jgi:hypothetical protein
MLIPFVKRIRTEGAHRRLCEAYTANSDREEKKGGAKPDSLPEWLKSDGEEKLADLKD